MLSTYERTTSAQRYIQEWTTDYDGSIEEYMEEYYYYFEMLSHGFIFNDGSVLDITSGEDHRVISMEDWDKYNILTYHYFNGELNLRIHNNLNYNQLQVIREFVEISDVNIIYVDYYVNRELVKSDQINYYSVYSLNELNLINELVS